MNPATRAYLDLIRLPNLFTATADILAGYLFVGGRTESLATLITLMAASSCLYAGGVALNDVCDAEKDRIERSDRPIPSGRIRRRTGLILAGTLLLVGQLAATTCSSPSGFLAGGVIVSILLYNVVLKSTPFAPAMMGLCRALNLLLGMSYAGHLPSAPMLIPVVFLWLYTGSVTYLAREEAGTTTAWRLRIGVSGVCLACGGLASLRFFVQSVRATFLFGSISLTIALGWIGYRAASSVPPRTVQRAVRGYVLAIIYFDACVAWSTSGILGAAVVASLAFPAYAASRFVRVT